MQGLTQVTDDTRRSTRLRQRVSATPISFWTSLRRIVLLIRAVLLAILPAFVGGCDTEKPSDRDARIVNPVGSQTSPVEPNSPVPHGDPPANPEKNGLEKAGPEREVNETASSVNPVAEFQSALTAKIKLKNSAGETQFSIKPEPDGAKLMDAAESELARYNLRGDKLKIKSADDSVLGYVTGGRGHYFIGDPAEKIVHFELQRQTDGDWKLKDGNEQLVCSIRQREYGFEIEDFTDKSLFKCKLKDGKRSLRDASDQTVFQTRDPIPMAAMVCLGLESIESLPLRFGLVVRLAIEGTN